MPKSTDKSGPVTVIAPIVMPARVRRANAQNRHRHRNSLLGLWNTVVSSQNKVTFSSLNVAGVLAPPE